MNYLMVMLHSVTGEEPQRGRLRHLYPRGAFKCKDGYIALLAPNDLIWQRLCRAMAREDLIDDPRSAEGTARAANGDFLDPIIERWLAGQTRAEAEAILNSHGVPAGPVYTASDVFDSPQVQARKLLVSVDDPESEAHLFARTPPLLSEALDIKTEPAPRLGEHTWQVLHDILGYTAAEIDRLEKNGIVETR